MPQIPEEIQAAKEAAEQAEANEANNESEVSASEAAAAETAGGSEAEAEGEGEAEADAPVDQRQVERDRITAKRREQLEQEMADSRAADPGLAAHDAGVDADAEGTSEDPVVRAQQLRDRAKKLDAEAGAEAEGEGAAAEGDASGAAIDKTGKIITLKIFGVDREYPEAKVMAGGGPEVYAMRVAAEMRNDQVSTKEAENETARAELETEKRDLAKREADLRKRSALPAAGEGSGPSVEGRSEQRAVEVSDETINKWAAAVFAGADEASIKTATHGLLSEVAKIRSEGGAISSDQVQQIVRDAIAADREQVAEKRKSDEAVKRKTAFSAANKIIETEFAELTVKGSRENNIMNAEFKTLLADTEYRHRPLTDVAREAGKRALATLNPEPVGKGPDLEARRRAKKLAGPKSKGSGLTPKTAVTEVRPKSRHEYVNDMRKARGQPPLE